MNKTVLWQLEGVSLLDGVIRTESEYTALADQIESCMRRELDLDANSTLLAAFPVLRTTKTFKGGDDARISLKSMHMIASSLHLAVTNVNKEFIDDIWQKAKNVKDWVSAPDDGSSETKLELMLPNLQSLKSATISLLNWMWSLPEHCDAYIYSLPDESGIKLVSNADLLPLDQIMEMESKESDGKGITKHALCCFRCETSPISSKLFPQKLLVCARCHQLAYCGRECQVEDWRSFHKRECKQMKKIHENMKQTQKIPRAAYQYAIYGRCRRMHVTNLLGKGANIPVDFQILCESLPGIFNDYMLTLVNDTVTLIPGEVASTLSPLDASSTSTATNDNQETLSNSLRELSVKGKAQGSK